MHTSWTNVSVSSTGYAGWTNVSVSSTGYAGWTKCANSKCEEWIKQNNWTGTYLHYLCEEHYIEENIDVCLKGDQCLYELFS